MAYQTLTLDVADRIAVLTVNRPDKLNALNDLVIRELGQAMDELQERDDVAGIVLTGAGRAFVAGADISEIAQRTAVEAKQLARARPGGLRQVRALHEADHRRGQRLRARRRLRAGDGMSSPHRVGAREVRPARGEARPRPRLRRHAASPAPGGARARPAAPADGRDDRRDGSAPHRAGERRRAGGGAARPHAGDAADDDRERADRARALHRGGQRGLRPPAGRGAAASRPTRSASRRRRRTWRKARRRSWRSARRSSPAAEPARAGGGGVAARSRRPAITRRRRRPPTCGCTGSPCATSATSSASTSRSRRRA